jgi:hypothetical protein
VFENRALKRIFGPKWEEVTGGWRKLHDDELQSCGVITVRRKEFMGRVACMRDENFLTECWLESLIESKVLSSLAMKVTAFCVVTPCGLVGR